MGKCRKILRCRVIGVVITEDEAISHSVVIAILDHTERGMSDEKLSEVKL